MKSKFIFIPISRNFEDHELLGELSWRSEASKTLEELLFSWLELGKPLTVGVNPCMPMPCISVTCKKEQDKNDINDVLAISSVPTSQLLASNKAFEALNEETIQLADKDSWRPDLEWFEERNDKLGIYFEEQLEQYIAPADSLTPLVLSYLMSTNSLIKITESELTVNGQTLYHLELVYLGKNLDSDEHWWTEEIYVEGLAEKSTRDTTADTTVVH